MDCNCHVLQLTTRTSSCSTGSSGSPSTDPTTSTSSEIATPGITPQILPQGVRRADAAGHDATGALSRATTSPRAPRSYSPTPTPSRGPPTTSACAMCVLGRTAHRRQWTCRRAMGRTVSWSWVAVSRSATPRQRTSCTCSTTSASSRRRPAWRTCWSSPSAAART